MEYRRNSLVVREDLAIQERARASKQHRSACHINQFTRVKVEVAESVIFDMTVDRNLPVSYLAKQIEAEYWFTQVLPAVDRLDAMGSLNSIAEIEPLTIEQLFNERQQPLRFTESIGKSVVFGEKISVIASGAALSHNEKGLDEIKTIGSGALENAAFYYELMYNKVAMEYFLKFCVENYCLENMLFWMDVESFRSLDDRESQFEMAKYILLMYLSSDAPLEINLLKDVVDDIPSPFTISSMTSNVFDEAQEHIEVIIREYTFQFLKSKHFKELQAIKSADVTTYESQRITGAYYLAFQSSLDIINRLIQKMDRSMQKAQEDPQKWLLFKSSLVASALEAYYPSIGTKDYFNIEKRKKWGLKKKSSIKDKKVKNLFNERVSVHDLERQVESAYFSEPRASKDFDVESTVSELLEELEYGVDVSNKQKFENNFIKKFAKIGKLEKLKSIFGESFTANDLKTVQESAEAAAAENTSSMSLGAVELDKEDRKAVARQSKKLQAMLGENVKDQVITGRLKTQRNANRTQEFDGVMSSSENLVKPSEMAVKSDEEYNTSDEDIEAVELERKKLNKLKYVLGEKVIVASKNAHPLPAAVPMRSLTVEERKIYQKKISKLEKMLGRILTADDVLTTQYLAPSASNPELDEIDLKVDSRKSVEESADEHKTSKSSKNVKKKKLNKLENMFGERISVSALKAAETDVPQNRPLTQGEKKKMRKKTGKLEQMLGEAPPQAIILQQNMATNASSDEISILETELDTIDQYIENEVDDEKTIRKKKSNKLSEILGEKVQAQEIFSNNTIPEKQKEISEPSRPMTLEEKRTLQRKMQKIGQLLGHTPDPESIAYQQDVEVDQESDEEHESVIPSTVDYDAKEYKKKRVDKLAGVLGERPPVDLLIHQQQKSAADTRPLTEKEKKMIKRKSNKIGQMLGSVPPAELITITADTVGDEMSDTASVISEVESTDLDVRNRRNQKKRVNKLSNMLGQVPPSEAYTSKDIDEEDEEEEEDYDNLNDIMNILSDKERELVNKRTEFADDTRDEMLDVIQDLLNEVDDMELDESVTIIEKNLTKRRFQTILELLNNPQMHVNKSMIPDAFAKPMTAQERKALKKRLTKLGHMLGEQPTADIVVGQANDIRKSMEDLSSLMEDTDMDGTPTNSIPSKNTKKKKLDKLAEVLGERPPQQMLVVEKAEDPVNDNQLTAEEKRLLQKRLSKLGQMLGEQPSPKIIATQTSEIKKSVEDLGALQSDSDISEDDVDEQNAKASVQRKRMSKLADMFGERLTADAFKDQPSDPVTPEERISETSSVNARKSVDRATSSTDKKTLQKRRSKIGQMLGESAPADIIVRQTGIVSADSESPSESETDSDMDNNRESISQKKKKIDKLTGLLGQRPPELFTETKLETDPTESSKSLLTTQTDHVQYRKDEKHADVNAFQSSTTAKKIDELLMNEEKMARKGSSTGHIKKSSTSEKLSAYASKESKGKAAFAPRVIPTKGRRASVTLSEEELANQPMSDDESEYESDMEEEENVKRISSIDEISFLSAADQKKRFVWKK